MKNFTNHVAAFGKKLTFLVAFLSISAFAFAQQRVTGTVTDANGEPVIGASVIVEGTTTGTTTGIDGTYSISAPKDANLLFAFLGFKDQTIAVAGKTTINVQMVEDAAALDEVVVIGYGTVKKRDLTGAVSSVKSEELVASPVANAIEAMQGRVAGLDITRNSGKAGSGSSILLRGNRSLTAGQEPLYIIDGIAGSIDNLNPNDIASIDVLKDASSTAIYGSAGANGVIMITTKQADAGKVQVDFDAYYGVNGFAKYPNTLSKDAWLDYLNEGYYATNGARASSQAELFTAWGMNYDQISPYLNAGKWINWADETLHTGTQQNYSVSVRGGNETVKGNFSLGYNQTKGIYKNDKVDMYTARGGVDVKIAKWIKAGIQMGLTFRDSDSRSSRLNKSFSMIPLGDVYDENGNINIYPIDGMQDYVSLINDDREGVYSSNSKSIHITANPYVDITILPELTFRSILGTSLSHSRSGTFQSDEDYMALMGSRTAIRNATYGTSLGYSYTWENILNYNKTFAEDHTVGATLITSWSKSQNESSSAYNEGFLYNDFMWFSLQAGNNPSVTSGYSHKNKMSFAARVNYSYKGKYLFTASVRRDGVSQLYNHWDTFPAAAIAWRISDEGFMQGAKDWLDNLKLRAGYGVSGNPNVGAYVSRTEVTSAGLDAINFGSGQVPVNVLTQAVGNAAMGWEKSYNLNVGLDFGMFNGRIDGSIEYYDTDTKDVLYSRSLPATGGQFNAKNPYKMVANIARMHNRGVELTLNTRNIVTKNFTWTSTLTFAYNKEQVKSIDLGSNTSVDDLVSLGLFMGHPKSTMFGLKKIGIWQKGEEADAAVFGLAPGDVKIQSRLEKKSAGLWTLTEEDGTVTEYTAENPYTIDADDRIIYGQGSPKTTWGFNNTFVWKNFDLNVFITARWGHMISGALLGYFKYGTKNMPAFYDYWTEENPTNDFPRPYLSRSTEYSDPTASLSVVDGSYWKVKNITLGYSLPKKLTSKINMSRARVYATVHNPFIFAKSHLLKDVDPETGADDSFPIYKQIVFGINVSF